MQKELLANQIVMSYKIKDDYIIDRVIDTDGNGTELYTEFWICHKTCGIKEFMFGVIGTYIFPKDEWIEDSINIYKEKYMI